MLLFRNIWIYIDKDVTPLLGKQARCISIIRNCNVDCSESTPAKFKVSNNFFGQFSLLQFSNINKTRGSWRLLHRKAQALSKCDDSKELGERSDPFSILVFQIKSLSDRVIDNLIQLASSKLNLSIFYSSMALADTSRSHSLIPSFLYSPIPQKTMVNATIPMAASSPPPSGFMIPAPSEPAGKIQLFSPAFYAACTVGGSLCCGLTHMAVTPLDLVKCNMQVRLFSLGLSISRPVPPLLRS